MKIDDTEQIDLFPAAEDIFRTNYHDILMLENRRRSMISVFIFTSLLIGILAVFAISFLIGIFRSAPSPYELNSSLLYGIAATIGFIPLQYRILDDFYRKLAKRKFLDIIARSLHMRYRRSGFFPLVSVYDHHILPPYSTRKVEEGFSGKLEGFLIEFQDFFISPVRRIHDGFGYRSVLTYRHHYGLVMKIRLNKYFNHHTVLLPSRDVKGFLKQLPNQNLFLHETVNLAYHGFTRRYACLSTHQVEARYIMDPAVMERFTILAETFDTDRISASFMNDEMIVVMRPLVNLFEIGSLRDPVTVLSIERTLHQIHALCQMAKIFELNAFAGLGATVSTPS